MLFIVALVLMLQPGDGVAAEAPEVAAEAPEIDLPADMRDPVGLVPAKEAAVILRGWLELDDWYVQTVAVIRLKELGQTLKPEELQRFFRAAALCNGTDLKLVRRPLDALTPQEARDGVGLLLKANCRWAAPYAIRFDTPGTSDWLRAELRRSLGLDDRDPNAGGRADRRSARNSLKLLLALDGKRCLPFLIQLAAARLSGDAFDDLLRHIESLSPTAALTVARRRPPTDRFQTTESFRMLLKYGNGADAARALRYFGRHPHGRRPDRYLKGAPPKKLAPMLADLAGTVHDNDLPSVIALLARSNEPAAAKACLAALNRECTTGESDRNYGRTARILAENNRADLRPKVLQLARLSLRQAKRIDNLMPMLLLNAGPDVYDLVAANAFREYGGLLDGVRKYLIRFPERGAELALKWARSDERDRRGVGIDMLFDLEDARAVPVLLNRWEKRPEGAELDDSDYEGFELRDSVPWTLRSNELTYLTAFVPPEHLARAGHAIVHHRPGRLYAMGSRYASRTKIGPPPGSTEPLNRIRDYIAEYRRAALAGPKPNRPRFHVGSRPSTVRILQLRRFTAGHLRPLVDSPNTNVRILATHLLGGWDGVFDAESRIILEHMLDDKSEEVRAAAFRALCARRRDRGWHYDRLLRGKPDGSGRYAVARAVTHWSHNAPKAVERAVLHMLVSGEHCGLAALEKENPLPNETAILTEALTGKAMTAHLAKEICSRLLARSGDAYAPIEAALKQPIALPVRVELVRQSAAFATVPDRHVRAYWQIESHHLDRGNRIASPAARRVIVEALASKEPKLRDAALFVQRPPRVPESIPTLAALIKQADKGLLPALIHYASCQGLSPVLAAALRPLVGPPLPLGQVRSDAVMAFLSVAGPDALPELRALVRMTPNGKHVASEYARRIAVPALMRFGDDATLREQASWVRSKLDRFERARVPEPLRVEAGKLVLADLAELALPDEALTPKKVDLLRELLTWDPNAGVPLLISALERIPDGGGKDRAELRSALRNWFGGSAGRTGSAVRPFAKVARQARRWWQLEGGRSLKVLRQDALFP
jgi:hypothetical protein